MTTESTSLPAVDEAFVQAATVLFSTQIEAGKLAHKNTYNPNVRSFARHIIADCMRLTVQLQAVAPPGVTVLKDNFDTGLLDSLRPLTDNDFDHAYAKKLGLDTYKEGIAAFEKEAKQTPSLKQAAQEALPTLREHYLMSQQLANKLGVTE